MTAPAKEKQSAAESSNSVALLYARISRLKLNENARNTASLVLFVSASALWLVSITRADMSQDALPWFLSIGLFAAFSVRFLKIEKPVLCLLGMPKNHEPLRLQESVSACFLLMALALYVWVGYSIMHPAPKTTRLLQVVDIQLISMRDFQNNNEILPGMQEKEELRKRVADKVSQTGSLAVSKVVTAPSKSEHKENKSQNPDLKMVKSEGQAKVERQDKRDSKEPSNAIVSEPRARAEKAIPIMVPSSWQTKVIKEMTPAAARAKSPAHVQADQPYISEVEPPELVELMENDGALDAMHVFQKGGKSSGGKGAENGLSVYLKELNRKIKNAWAPPMGSSRQVVVLFRLKRDGKLEFVKVSTSSGENVTDGSACKAVAVATSNGQPLPKDFSAKYLDLMYTFNYNVDELQELSSAQ